MNYSTIIEDLGREIAALPLKGKTAQYIPILAKVDPHKFGVCLINMENEVFTFGDAQEKFSIQSIAKVLSLTLAIKTIGTKIWERVGVEPSGTAFNSLVQLEYELGIPRNPMINAGAIVVCDILNEHLSNPKQELLEFIRLLCGNEQLEYSEEIIESEKSKGFRNAAHINLMKTYENIHGDIDVVLDLYYSLCSIEMTCVELSSCFSFLAKEGMSSSGKRILTERQTKRVNAIMQLCGFYDEAGEFSFKVGLPGKSGVGGGIVAVHPGHYCISTWSPPLNEKGNSYKGMLFLEEFTTRTESSIF